MSTLINNQWQPGKGDAFTSTNPATRETVWHGNAASTEQMDEALVVAQEAFPRWSILTPEERLEYLKKYQSILESRKDELARCISAEMGKPVWEANTEAAAMIAKIDITRQAFEERCPTETHPLAGSRSVLRYKPIGVTVVLGPFNLPGHLPNGHFVPSLLAGNTVIFKPSELTPKVGEIIAQCMLNAQLPPGVFQMVQGRAEVGRHLTQASTISGLFFTGSYNVGSQIHRSLGGRPEVMLALEMGGNNPLIIQSYEDTKAAIYSTMLSAYITSGQRCTCARRLIMIESEQNESFLKQLIASIKKIRVGTANDSPEPFMGPVANEAQAKNIVKQYQQLLDKGAKEIIPLKQDEQIVTLLSPSVLEIPGDVTPPDEEIFGPVLQLYRANNLDHAITLANQTSYGLSAGIITTSYDDYKTFYDRITTGVINWNSPTTGASSKMPFGGAGKSGNYRPSGYFAVDYCTFPTASFEKETLSLPEKLNPGIAL